VKILLFGASGLFGTAFEAVCAAPGIEFAGVTHGDVEVTDHGAVTALIDAHQPTVVVNAVAIVGIDPCEERPDLAYAVNAAAPLAMGLHCAAKDICFVQTSTHAVFDGSKSTAYTEADQPNPISVYSVSKFAGECFVRDVCPKHYITRFPTMYGRRRNASPGFVDKMVDRFRQGVEIRVADDKFDSPSYAHDVATGLADLLQTKRPYGTYHLANAGNVNYYEFISALKELLGANNPVHRAKDRDFPGRGHKPLRTAVTSSRLPPMRDWRAALAEYVTQQLEPA